MRKFINSCVGWFASIPADKYKHFAVSAIVAAACLIVAELCGAPRFFSILCSFIGVSLVGLAKEFGLDSEPDPLDLIANYVGAAIIWITYLFM